MKKLIKQKAKFFAAALVILMCLSLSATLSSCGGNSGRIVGISMPKQDVDRWTEDGQNLKNLLEAKGYKVILEYAEDSPEKQIQQIENMCDQGCTVLLIAGVDCYGALNEILERAAKEKITIVAYDRLIMNTENVDYYVTFDNFEIGETQAKYIVDKFKLDGGGDPVIMELFSGALDDSCTPENYGGQMSVLQQYIDDGRVIIKSGEVSMESTAIADWSTENAKARMENLLNLYYSDGTRPDAILSTNDSMAKGIIEALKNNGYENGTNPFPLITGMDCDKDNIISIINGEQTMSMFIDTRALANRAVDLLDDVLMNKTPSVNDTGRYENGVKAVPAAICKSSFVDIDNYTDVLVRSGYYSEEDLK